MGGKLFDSPVLIVIIIVVALLLFGAPKLPGMARSIGQSLRIFKSEVKQMKDDPERPGSSEYSTDSDEDSEPVEGRVVKDSRGSTDRHSKGTSGTSGPPADRNS